MLRAMHMYIIIWIFGKALVNAHSYCSPVYGGSDSCSFLPAPPGKTPPCARPGLTYCEYPDHYPGQLIHHLVQKWLFDHRTLLSDESKEDFASYIYPPPSSVYGPPNYQHFGPSTSNHRQQNNYFPEPIYIPKPQYSFQDSSINYLPPKGNFTGYLDRSNQLLNYKYTNSIPAANRYYNQQYQPHGYYRGLGQQLPQYTNDIWSGKIENYERLKRSLRRKRSQYSTTLLESRGKINVTLHRRRRQSTISGEPLCRTRSQYIVPKAALNNKGNWMYVVNMPEVNNQFSQLVKSETCISQTCSGLCSLPQGYSSRCEQKYVQKRLVALEGGGSELYNDIFWFPSCCVCTVSNT